MTESLPSLLPLLLPLIAAGLFAGLIAGLLGVGGGIVMVPVMSVVLSLLAVASSVSMHVAVATSLAVIVSTSLSSARAHAIRGAVDREVVKRWAPCIAAGAFAGALLARWLDGDILRLLFATLAVAVALRLLLSRSDSPARLSLGRNAQRASAGGIGVLSAWLGIGGGTFSVPLLHALGQPMQRAVGSSALLGLAIALPATLGYIAGGIGVAERPQHSLGYLHLPSVLVLSLSAVFVAPLGARLAHALSRRRLQQAFGVFLLLAAARLLHQAAL